MASTALELEYDNFPLWMGPNLQSSAPWLWTGSPPGIAGFNGPKPPLAHRLAIQKLLRNTGPRFG